MLAPQRGLIATVHSSKPQVPRRNMGRQSCSNRKSHSRNCQTPTASPAEPGVSLSTGEGVAHCGGPDELHRKILSRIYTDQIRQKESAKIRVNPWQKEFPQGGNRKSSTQTGYEATAIPPFFWSPRKRNRAAILPTWSNSGSSFTYTSSTSRRMAAGTTASHTSSNSCVVRPQTGQ